MFTYGDERTREQIYQHKRKTFGQRFSKPAAIVSLIGLVFFVIAASSLIVTIQDEEFNTRSERTRRDVQNTTQNTTENTAKKINACDFSEEAVRVGKC